MSRVKALRACEEGAQAAECESAWPRGKFGGRSHAGGLHEHGAMESWMNLEFTSGVGPTRTETGREGHRRRVHRDRRASGEARAPTRNDWPCLPSRVLVVAKGSYLPASALAQHPEEVGSEAKLTRPTLFLNLQPLYGFLSLSASKSGSSHPAHPTAAGPSFRRVNVRGLLFSFA